VELTEVEAEVDGDTHFPEFDPAQWPVVHDEAHAPDERHALAYRFVSRVRRDAV
jgi:dihydrofolate reductase